METFPKTTVDVFALVLESGGSDFAVVISCASLALADAGIMIIMTLQHPVHGKIISFRICRVLPQWLTRVTVVGTRKLRWWKADALKLETGEVMETKAQLESELKKTYREVETVQDIKPRGMEMDSEDDTKKTILLMP
ncbi:hypothetical protein F2Q68_00012957 [Brassica cretica]|uniref:Exoribonuclease phosphorolytic domain-containing protein n=1 Tax=Brassica cretica TaxID=69181 RepID=A0A8S9HC41_BRACR|nr:hypothetical protein F2Q68_00012957 [Brassica cretica]